jgi:threonyl-tRNA synthetase
VLGSLERFVGGLIEHFAGKFPFWLAPEQIAIIPIREEHAEYARDLARKLEAVPFRVACLDEPSHMNKRIKHAQENQVPYMLVVGEREAAEGSVAVRRRGTRDQESVSFERFLTVVKELQRTRSLELPGVAPQA